MQMKSSNHKNKDFLSGSACGVNYVLLDFLNNLKGPNYSTRRGYSNTQTKCRIHLKTRRGRGENIFMSTDAVSTIFDLNSPKKKTKDSDHDLYQQTVVFIDFIYNLSDVIGYCLHLFQNNLRPKLAYMCDALLENISRSNSCYRHRNSSLAQNPPIKAIQLWNEIIHLLETYDSFVDLAEMLGEDQIEKGFSIIQRRKQMSSKCKVHKKQGDVSANWSVKLSAKTSQLPNDIRILRQLPDGDQQRVLPSGGRICLPVYQLLNNPNHRLQTYSAWPTSTKVWPVQLNNAGFYFTGKGTIVKCSFCGIETAVGSWPKPEKPEVVHFKLNNNCEFLRGNFPNLETEITKNCSAVGENRNALCLAPNYGKSIIIKESHEYTAHKQNGQMDNTYDGYATERPISLAMSHETPADYDHNDHSGNTQASNNPQIIDRGVENICLSERDTESQWQDRNIDTSTSLLLPSHNGFQSNDGGLSRVAINTSHSSTIFIDYPSSTDIPNREYEPEFSHPEYRCSEQRSKTYQHWTKENIQPSNNLVDCGLFFTGEDDIVRCFCCNLGLSEWAADDNPWTEHARHAPRCWFLRRQKGHDYIDKVQKSWQKKYKPINAAFDDYQSRLATFGGWREDIAQTPADLADAGFFFTGEEDIVRCHYCDGGLRNWESGDIPWEEHARWFPRCKYLVKMKGLRYIESIKEKYENGVPTAAAEYKENTGENSLLETEPVKSVQRMGFSLTVIKAAVNKYVQTRGSRNFSESDLVDIIFKTQTSSCTPNRDALQTYRPVPEEKDIKKLRDINTELKTKRLCVLCKQNERQMLFVNCGHRVTCEQCCRSIDFCPTCDKRVKKVVKTFLS